MEVPPLVVAQVSGPHSISGPLYLLFPLPRILFPKIFLWMMCQIEMATNTLPHPRPHQEVVSLSPPTESKLIL